MRTCPAGVPAAGRAFAGSGMKIKLSRLFGIGLFLLAAAASLSVSAATARDYLQDARHYFDKKAYPSAVIQLKNALQQDPKNAQARLLLGDSYVQLHRGASAAKELERARELGVPKQRWLVLLGRAYLLEGHNSDVLKKIKVDSSLPGPVQAGVLSVRGRAYLGERRLMDAKDSFNRALAIVPDQADALLGLARIAMLNDQPKQARRHVDKALKADPHSGEGWTLKGEIERAQGDLKAAETSFRKAVAADPHDIAGHLGLVAVHVGMGKNDEALREVNGVLDKAPRALVANYLKAVVLFNQHKLESARGLLQGILKTAPGYLPAQLLAGTIDFQQNNLNQAQEHLQRYVSSQPKNLAAVKLLAATYLKQNDADRAVVLLEKHLKSAPGDAQLLALLGSAYLHTGKSDRAIQYLHKAIEAAPDAAAFRAQLAVGYLRIGEDDKAVSELKSAVGLGKLMQADVLLVLTEIHKGDFDGALKDARAMAAKNPKDPLPYNLIGAAYLGKKEMAKARQAFRHALGIKADFSAARMNLARMDIQAGDLDKARQQYETILENEEGNLGALMGMAELASRSGDQDKALDWLKKAQRKNPEALGPGLLLVSHYLKTQAPLKAMDVARQMQSAHPRNPRVLKALGLAQMGSGLDASAESTFQQLTETTSKSAESWYLLGTAQLRRSDYDNARKSFRKSLDLDPKHVPSEVGLARIAMKTKQTKRAHEIAARIQKQYPDQVTGYAVEANLYAETGKYGDAARAYAEAYQRAPSAELAIKQYQMLTRHKEPQAAIKPLEHWLARKPDDRRVRLVLASAYQAAGRDQEAIKAYEAVVARDKSNVMALNNLAWLYQGRDANKSLQYARRAYKASPDRPEVMDTLGWIMVQQGRYHQGLSLLQDAVSKAPHLSEVRYHMAVALAKVGRKDDARSELDRVLQTDPDFPSATAARALRKRLGG